MTFVSFLFSRSAIVFAHLVWLPKPAVYFDLEAYSGLNPEPDPVDTKSYRLDSASF